MVVWHATEPPRSCRVAPYNRDATRTPKNPVVTCFLGVPSCNRCMERALVARVAFRSISLEMERCNHATLQLEQCNSEGVCRARIRPAFRSGTTVLVKPSLRNGLPFLAIFRLCLAFLVWVSVLSSCLAFRSCCFVLRSGFSLLSPVSPS